MKIGKARYCDNCGVEVVSGDYCSSCDPENGSEELSYTFICTRVEQEPVTVAQSTGHEVQWWAFWRR